MKTKNLSRAIIYLILLIVFNLIYYLTGGVDHSGATWMAYAFIHVALIVSYIAPLYCINYKRIPENLATIYGFAWLYSIVSIILNAVIIYSKTEKYKWGLILNVVLIGIYIIQLVINLSVNHAVEENLENVDAERQYVKEISYKLKDCLSQAKNSESKKAIERAYDIVRTSPLHSKGQAMNYEVEVIRLADKLADALTQNQEADVIQIADGICLNAQKRNEACRSN